MSRQTVYRFPKIGLSSGIVLCHGLQLKFVDGYMMKASDIVYNLSATL